ncbi:hypothetical protein ALC53_04397 [Atta colombica]|uniref:Uncharacterized protein n=1 Tax=Atta colombica TaxID=520822 RepID=A0A195BLX3_9HYME|nr:hypothetical protein ALC53_04397 [Atta colombica]
MLGAQPESIFMHARDTLGVHAFLHLNEDAKRPLGVRDMSFIDEDGHLSGLQEGILDEKTYVTRGRRLPGGAGAGVGVGVSVSVGVGVGVDVGVDGTRPRSLARGAHE